MRCSAATSPALATRKIAKVEPWWKLGGTPRYCTYDDRVQVTAGKSSGMSPANLSGDALGDRIKERYPHSRVMALALKDRASILMGGRRADAAYWFDRDLPGFVSSSYYRFNPAVFSFNALVPGYMPGSAEWRPAPYIPPDELHRVTRPSRSTARSPMLTDSTIDSLNSFKSANSAACSCCS